MARPREHTVEQMKEALTKSNGFLKPAAEMLGCDTKTIFNYMQRYPELKEHKENVNEDLLDFVENQLLKQIKAENLTAIIFFLKTRGRSRGYSERVEVSQEIEFTENSI